MDPWVERELGDDFPDQRLEAWLGKLLGDWGRRIGGTVPMACQDWAATKAAYRFFSNPRIDEGVILGGHFAATAARFAETPGMVLVLHDTTEFSFTHKTPDGVGYLSYIKGRHAKGPAQWSAGENRALDAAAVSLVLVRDVAGQWRDEALLATSSDVSAEFVIAGYCRRWSVEVVFFESKQFLGLHDPQVWSAGSVERAHPMAWFVQSVTILWYAVAGREGTQVERDRPWYTTKKTPTFADMLGALRLQLWEMHVSNRLGSDDDHAELLDSLINWLAAVRWMSETPA